MEYLNEELKEDSFDIREFLEKYLSYWPWYLVFSCLGFIYAWYINQKTVPVYEVKTTILVKENRSVLDARFSNTLSGLDNSFQVQNEIGIIKSRSIISKAISRGKFRVGYYQEDFFVSKELYNNCPFELLIDTSLTLPLNTKFNIEINSSTQFLLSSPSVIVSLEHIQSSGRKGETATISSPINAKIGEDLSNTNLHFKVIRNQNFDLKLYTGKKYSFIIFNDLSLYQQFRSFTVSDIKTSTMLVISMRGNQIAKMCDFLNLLSQVYLEKGTEKKNMVAENTIRFIDNQLGDVTDSLHTSETVLQKYKSANQIMDVETQSKQVYTTLEKLQDQRAELTVRQKYYDYLLQYFKENNDGKNLIAPSSIGVNEQMLNSFITDLTNLYNERAELTFNSKRENIYLISNEEKIKNLINTALENVKNLKKASEFSIQDIDRRIEELASQVNNLPEKQRKLFGFERKFKLNDALYTYLLTKRSEVQIAKASYFPDNEILDKATGDEYSLIAPNKQKNYIIGFLIGFLIPLLFVILRDYLNNKILSSLDIEKITEFPVLGHIINNKEKISTVVFDVPGSLTTESFRAMRTNIQFVASENKKHTMLITSSGMGEGKSFFSLNLALCYAMYNKKTVLLNFDLRRPKLQDYMGLDNSKGLSLVLSGNSSWQENIQPTGFKNLDVLMSGPIPPNPMELIAGENTQALFSDLNEQYDYIIIDTPPVGLIADALLLLKYSDVNLFIVRQNVTPKKAFSQTIHNLAKRDFKYFNIVLNDTRMSRRYYTNNYNYQYGYEPDKIRRFAKWFKKGKA